MAGSGSSTSTRWDKDIEISDDEDATHPNIDTASYFRWRHESRLLRMKEMEEEKSAILKEKEELAEQKLSLEQKRDSGEDVFALDTEYTSKSLEHSKRQEAYDDMERTNPWNVDTIGHEVFSKTVINSNPSPRNKALVPTPIDKKERLQLFLKEKKPLAKQFGMLRKYYDSMKFLQDNPEMLCDETMSYLVLWCLELAMDKKFDLMEHVSHQCITMQFLVQLFKELYKDPRTCVTIFYTKMMHSKPVEYLEAFNKELGEFRERIRKRAEEKLKIQEEKDRKARLGPGGLDPREVMASLPPQMKVCFETENVPMLQEVLAEMPEMEAMYHMTRCINAGIWTPDEDCEDRSNEADV